MKLIRGLAMLLALAAAGCEPAPTDGQGPEPGRYPGDGVTAIQQAATQSYATPYLNMSTYPFTVEPVNVAVGWISGNNWVLYQRKSDQHCTFYQVSSTSQVSGVQLIVSASRGADTVYVPTTGQNYWFYCANYGASWEVDPLNVAPQHRRHRQRERRQRQQHHLLRWCHAGQRRLRDLRLLWRR
jgi:hypothetical protein